MKSARTIRRNVAAPRNQRGVVLLIALIILVAMTLAGIGMMRSVDTGTVVAGNMAFRQSADQASDAGIVTAAEKLFMVSNSSNSDHKLLLNFNNGHDCPPEAATSPLCTCPSPAPPSCIPGKINFPGYFSAPFDACEVMGGCTAAQTRWWETYNWNNAPVVPVNDPVNGNRIADVRYVIHRMCRLPNQVQTWSPFNAVGQLCQFEEPPCAGQAGCGYRFFFRITARTEGVRNTVTYTQQFALIDPT